MSVLGCSACQLAEKASGPSRSAATKLLRGAAGQAHPPDGGVGGQPAAARGELAHLLERGQEARRDLDRHKKRASGVKAIGVDERIWHPSRISCADKAVTVMVGLTRGTDRRLRARLLDAVQGRSGTGPSWSESAQPAVHRGPLVDETGRWDAGTVGSDGSVETKATFRSFAEIVCPIGTSCATAKMLARCPACGTAAEAASAHTTASTRYKAISGLPHCRFTGEPLVIGTWLE
jgi:hypothetical protein